MTINNNTSTHAYENEKHDRYYGKDAVIKFALEGGYNKIYLKNGTDLTTEGLKEAEAYEAGTATEEEIYLAKVNNDGEVLNSSNPFKITFEYDPDAPQCSEIKFGEENKVVTDLVTTITFGIYKNKNIEAKVVLSDELSGIQGWSYYVANTAKDVAFKDLLTEDDYAEELTKEHFTAGATTGANAYTVSVGKLKDGETLGSNNYIVFVKVKDNVGNTKIYGSNGIVLENFHDITVEYNEKPASATTQQGTVDSRTYYSGDAELDLTAKENASESKFYSGLEKMQYTISRHWGDGEKVTEEVTESNKRGFPKDKTLEDLKKYCIIEKYLELKNNPEKSQVITVSATANDNAGNAMETRADYTLVLDSIAPTVESSYAQANNNGAFLNAKYANSDVTYSVNVTERFLNELKVTLNGTAYTLDELNSQKDALGIKEISMDPVNNFADTKDSTVYRFTIVFHKDGEYTVQTKVADAAGNKGEDKEFSFVIDTVRPEMQVTYTAYRPNGTSFVLDPSRGRAYANEEVAYVAVTAVITERNFDATLTITVDERNFDESYQPQVTSTAGGGYSISGWSHNGEIHTATVTFSGDSDYTVTYDCFDLAGNKSNTEKLDEFTVDKTKPVIQVSYDNNSALNNNYYKEARTATITITEHNFSPGEVTVTTTAQLDGAAASVPGVSGWSGSGDTHVATVSYSADADYTFIISATDLASNVSDPYATESFTVDQTKPTVEITNIEDRSANNGEVAPVITLNDINFDSGKTVVHLTGANKGEVDTTGMYTSTASNKGQTLTFYNFKENMDDIYTLTAETTDKAGNQYSTSKIFSVNRDGSTYLYDDYTEELIKNGYTNDPKNLVVSEINVDTLTFWELMVSENGTQKTLEQNKDFEVSESGSDVSWKEYKYTINASNFENEGDYNVSIYSEDRATNVTTNTAKSKDILFAVDKTSPVISLANIEDGGRYKVESQKFTANVDDNMALDKVEYYVDDELKQTFDADEVSANGGSLELSVDSSNTFRNVSVKAYDKANNEATTASVDVLVSANTWVQFYNNKPAFYGTIGGGVAAVAAAVAAGVHFSGAAAGTAAVAGKTAAGAGIFLAGKKRKKMKSK